MTSASRCCRALIVFALVGCSGGTDVSENDVSPVARADAYISETFSETAIAMACITSSQARDTAERSWFPEIGFSLFDYEMAWTTRCLERIPSEELAAEEGSLDESDALTLTTETPTTVPPECSTVIEGGTAEVRGRLVYRDESGERVGVPRVRLEAILDGQVVAETLSCSDGSWSMIVPPGDYEILLDEESLNGEVVLRNPDKNPGMPSLEAGDSKAVLFPVTRN